MTLKYSGAPRSAEGALGHAFLREIAPECGLHSLAGALGWFSLSDPPQFVSERAVDDRAHRELDLRCVAGCPPEAFEGVGVLVDRLSELSERFASLSLTASTSGIGTTCRRGAKTFCVVDHLAIPREQLKARAFEPLLLVALEIRLGVVVEERLPLEGLKFLTWRARRQPSLKPLDLFARYGRPSVAGVGLLQLLALKRAPL